MGILKFKLFIVLFFYELLSFKTLAQELSAAISLGETTISIERPFTISVIIQNSDTRPTLAFPEIKGFVKRGLTTSVTTSEIQGKPVVSQVITQSYNAVKPGQYILPPFSITIGETVVTSAGATLTVRPQNGVTSAPATGTVAESITKTVGSGDAFLSVRTSAGKVYVKEGFSVKLSFFVAESYPFELTFFELDQQLQELLKELRPANCWEENTGISELKPFPVTINNKRYSEYRIYQATFFPLNLQPIQLPSVRLRMIQFKPATTPGGQRQKEVVSFTSRPQAVTVIPLPPHPAQDQVAVGQYRLVEKASRLAPRIGQSLQYDFRVVGEGNIASMPTPVIPDTTTFDIFPPEIKDNIDRTGSVVSGFKNFRYALVPRQNGTFSLGKLFRWIYFDPRRQRYDTLRSSIVLRVGGVEPTSSDTVQVSLPGSIYTGIEQTDSSEQPLNVHNLLQLMANVVLIVLILGMIYLFWKK